MNWFVYMVKGSDNSLYTGISPNVEKRVDLHNRGLGAKSLRGKRPVTLVYFEKFKNRSEASKRETQIKNLNRKKKLELITRTASSMVEQPPLKG